MANPNVPKWHQVFGNIAIHCPFQFKWLESQIILSLLGRVSVPLDTFHHPGCSRWRLPQMSLAFLRCWSPTKCWFNWVSWLGSPRSKNCSNSFPTFPVLPHSGRHLVDAGDGSTRNGADQKWWAGYGEVMTSQRFCLGIERWFGRSPHLKS